MRFIIININIVSKYDLLAPEKWYNFLFKLGKNFVIKYVFGCANIYSYIIGYFRFLYAFRK